jgi:hypothetical protein
MISNDAVERLIKSLENRTRVEYLRDLIKGRSGAIYPCEVSGCTLLATFDTSSVTHWRPSAQCRRHAEETRDRYHAELLKEPTWQRTPRDEWPDIFELRDAALIRELMKRSGFGE